MTESQPDNTAAADAQIDALLSGGGDPQAAEIARLEAAIAAANARTTAARHRMAERDSAVRAKLRDEVLAAQAELAEMDRQHQSALASLRIATQAEIDRIASTRRDTPGAR